MRNGGNELVSSLNLFVVDDATGGMAISRMTCSSSATNEELAGFDRYINLALEEESVPDASALSDFYVKKVFDSILTINNSGGNQSALYVILHFPLYKPEALKTVEKLYEAMDRSGKATVTCFVGYADDMAGILQPAFKIEHPAHEQVKAFAAFRKAKDMPFTNHFVAIQNASQNGITLGLTTETLSEVIGQFATVCAEYYDEVFPGAVEYKDVVAFGISALCLDKYLFTQYLLNRTILNAMDHADVNRGEVNMSTACDTASLWLKDKGTILSDFYKQFAAPGTSAPNDSNAIQQQFDQEIRLIVERCRDYFRDDPSITSKAAIIAAILAKTECELFANAIFNQETTSVDDLFDEPIEYFTSENEKTGYYTIEGEPISNPVGRLKEINVELLKAEAEIRDLKGQSVSLEKQIDDVRHVDDCYVEDGFVHFQDKKFRLLPNVKEEPLEESYTAHAVNIPSIDLSGQFNAVKNQGQQGSCLAFTITSIFEYILKLNQSKEFDLSEAFLYYNAREMDEAGSAAEDKGSRFLPAMRSLRHYGIALESFCPYSDDIYDARPSDEAYADAATRKLLKALNVERTVDAIKSALSDGYPVAASFNLCQSFKEAANGVIPMPSEEEIAALLATEEENKPRHSRHAMVITGFSDEMQMFVVRNSWGTDWGMGGYCYIPYAYVGNPQLCNFSCVITEVESLAVARMETIPGLKIDDMDLTVRYIMTQASLESEIDKTEKLRKERYAYRVYFERLRKLLSSPGDRDTFIARSEAKLREELEAIKLEREAKREEQDKELEAYNSDKKDLIHKAIIFCVVFVYAFWLCNEAIANKLGWGLIEAGKIYFRWGLIVPGALILAGFFFLPLKLKKPIVTAFVVAAAFFSLAGVVTLMAIFGSEETVDMGVRDFTRSYLWLIPLYALSAGYVVYKGNQRWRQWRDKRDDLDEAIRRIGQRMAAKEKAINDFKIKTFAAWTLLKSLDKTQAYFERMYANLLSLINNLRTWYTEVAGSQADIDLESKAPSLSLLDKALLDRFFESELKENDAFVLDLTENIEKHEMQEEALKAYKRQLFEKIATALMAYPALAEFDISAHAADNSFANIANEVTRDTASRLDAMSGLFMHVSSKERGEIICSTSIFAPSLNLYRDRLRKKLGRYSEPYFESENKYRLTYVKTATLWFDECVALRKG
ncbi:MAG: hypothetical protein LBN29_08070 [Mediterranea sp.]|nr:hypothetical protein [Mediterranea sp.]